MSKNFNEKLIDTLKENLRFIDENDNSIIRNEVITSALKGDKELIELLIKDKEIRNAFFDKIEDYWIFNLNKFNEYIDEKNFLSNSYTKFRNKIGLNIDNKFLLERGEISLVWPFKDCILEAGMDKEDQNRNEIFFNETLAKDEIDRLFDPKVLTNFKKFTSKGEQEVKNFLKNENGKIKDNLIIKGNNLVALHSLKKEFAGKVKLIYIDPPYNTGGSAETFTYNNSFNHSTWLTFIKNRLDVAKEFLREDGFIAIAIDHVELFYLGVLADEIFGRDNRVGIVSVVHKPEGRQHSKFFSPSNEFMLVYAKNKELATFNRVVLSEEKMKEFKEKDNRGNFKWKNFIRGDTLRKQKQKGFYPIYVSKDLKNISLEKKEGFIEALPIDNKGTERAWNVQPDGFLKKLKSDEIKAEYNNKTNKIDIYYKIREQQVFTTHWTDKKYNATAKGTNLVSKMVKGTKVSYPKSVYTVLDTLKIITKDNDIIMDFFSGSGTTGHATLKLNKEDGGNRQFILIEQLDEHIKVSIERLKNYIISFQKEKNLTNYNNETNFIYLELMKYNEEAVNEIYASNNTENLLEIWEIMCQRYFLNYDIQIKAFNDNIQEFQDLSLGEQKKILCEMLNKNQLYVNLSEIKDSQFKIDKSIEKLNKKFYNVIS